MEVSVYSISNTIAFNLWILFTFWKSPNFHHKYATLLLLSLNAAIKFGLLTLGLVPLGNTRILELIFSLIALGIYTLFLRIGVSRILFTYFLIVDYVAAARSVAAFLCVYVLGCEPQSWPEVLLCIGLYGITLPPLLLLFQRYAPTIYDPSTASSLWRIIWLIPALNTFIMMALTNEYDPDHTTNFLHLTIRIVALASSLLIFFQLLGSLKRWMRQTILEQQVQHSQQILNLQRTQYTHLQEYLQEIRQARHDLRQHQRLIQGYLAKGDRQALQEYVEAYGMSLPADPGKPYCTNLAVDTLFRYYGEKFTKKGILLETHLDLPPQLSIPDPDLCVLFGNLLENALEACSGQEGAQIHAAANLTATGGLALVMDNTAPHPPKEQEGCFLSSTHPGLGVGTQSIRNIALQYHGMADLHWENGVFYASVLLNPSPEQKDTGKGSSPAGDSPITP